MVMEVKTIFSFPVDTKRLIEQYCKKHNYNVKFVEDNTIDKTAKLEREDNNIVIRYKTVSEDKLRVAFAQIFGTLAYNLTGKKKVEFSYSLCVPTPALTGVIRKHQDINEVEQLCKIFGVPDYVIIKRLVDLNIAPPWYPTVFPPVD